MLDIYVSHIRLAEGQSPAESLLCYLHYKIPPKVLKHSDEVLNSKPPKFIVVSTCKKWNQNIR